MRHQNI